MKKSSCRGLPTTVAGQMAFLRRSTLAHWKTGSHGGTYGGGNALSAAAACATIDVIRNEKLADNAAGMGNYLQERLQELQGQTLSRDDLLLKLGAAKKDAGRAYGLVTVRVPAPDQPVTAATFTFALNRKKLRQVRRREGRYLLRSNLTSNDPAQLWTWYIQLTEVEQAFKELKGDLSIRPIYHQLDTRIDAHIFVAFLAYCLQVTLKSRLRPLAPGLTPRSALEKFAAIQMVDVHLPTTDGRTLILSRHTEPEPEQQLLLERLRLQLPPQPPPRITATLEARLH